MVNLIPSGVDDSSGQKKQFNSGDTLVDVDGNLIVDGGFGASDTNTNTISVPANTLSQDGQALTFHWSLTETGGSPENYTIAFGSTILTAQVPLSDTGFVTGTIVRTSSSTWIGAANAAYASGGADAGTVSVGSFDFTISHDLQLIGNNITRNSVVVYRSV